MSDLLDFSPPGQVTFSLAGAKARFYNAGTTTLRTVYSDQAETIPHPDPLVADSSGRFAQAFVSGGPVKVVVAQSDDSTGYTLDPCEKVAATGAGAAGISFEPTLALPYDNVQDAVEGAAASAASGFTPFGLGVTGSVALLADIDATNTATGQYRFDATTTGTFPTGITASDTGAIEVKRETSGSAWMWLYPDTNDRIFVRRMNSSTWGTWRQNVTSDQSLSAGDILYRGSTNVQRLAIGTASQILRVNAGATAPEWANVSGISLQSPVTMSGTLQDFSGIPSTANRVTLNWNGVSVSGTDTISILLGTASSFETTGYEGCGAVATTGGTAIVNHSGDFRVYDNIPTATMLLSGSIVFTRVSGDIWAVNGNISPDNNTRMRLISGRKSLSGALTRIRVQTTGLVQTFDAGTISIAWE